MSREVKPPSDRAVASIFREAVGVRRADLLVGPSQVIVPSPSAERPSGSQRAARMAENLTSLNPARAYMERPAGVAISSARTAPVARAHSITALNASLPIPLPRYEGRVQTLLTTTNPPRGTPGDGAESCSVPIAQATTCDSCSTTKMPCFSSSMCDSNQAAALSRHVVSCSATSIAANISRRR